MRLAVVLAAALILLGASAAGAAVNRDTAFVQVYVNNVENLEMTGERPCPGDWKDLIAAMRVQQPSPDLFLVQQVSDLPQLNVLIAEMTRTLPGRYAGVIAQSAPRPFNSPCGADKARQTNAIVYRIGRFDVVPGTQRIWRADRRRGKKCVDDSVDRTVNVAVTLHDKFADRNLRAVSFHWPTGRSGGPPCAGKNVRELSDNAGRTEPLAVLGGDGNVVTSSGSWYARANGDRGGRLGFRDATFAACNGAPACIRANWTISPAKHRRIDYLFARRADGVLPAVGEVHTITFGEGNRADKRLTGSDNPHYGYSDHRAVRARVFY